MVIYTEIDISKKVAIDPKKVEISVSNIPSVLELTLTKFGEPYKIHLGNPVGGQLIDTTDNEKEARTKLDSYVERIKNGEYILTVNYSNGEQEIQWKDS